jgi:hypothetical protein
MYFFLFTWGNAPIVYKKCTVKQSMNSEQNVQCFLKVWWPHAALFVYFYFSVTIRTCIQSFSHNIRWGPSPYLHSCRLSGRNLPGVPSRDSNSGLPYSKPALYQLSCAAPYWAALHPIELRCTLTELRCTLLPTELRCTLLSCAAPSELRCTLLSCAAPCAMFCFYDFVDVKCRHRVKSRRKWSKRIQSLKFVISEDKLYGPQRCSVLLCLLILLFMFNISISFVICNLITSESTMYHREV